MLDGALKASAKEYQALLDEIPLGRMATEEIAAVVLFLPSDAAAFITGATYVMTAR